VRANQTAAEFFRVLLKHAEHGEAGRLVIKKRGIAPEMVETFGLGVAPGAGRWDGLLSTLQKKGLSARVFAEAGLLKQRDDGGFYDAFRNRLMFPIQDQIGRVIAFGARKIDEADEPKYLNSPETRLFEKSGTLFGLFQAARSIQSERTAVVTEGYTDTIACHQAGITNVVATLGTALTKRHAEVLRRLCDTIVLLFDGDEAGKKAADRAVEVFFAIDIDVKIATLARVTDAKDPDELLKRPDGVETLRKAIDGALDLLQYRYERLRERLAGAGMAALNRAVEEDLTQMVALGLGTVLLRRRALIVKKIAQITKLPEQVIAQSIPGGRRPETSRVSTPTGSPPPLSVPAQAMGCLMCEPTLWIGLSDAEREALDPAHLDDPAQRAVAEAIGELAAMARPCDVSSVMTLVEDSAAAAAASDMYMRIAHATSVSDKSERNKEEVRMLFRDCMKLMAVPAEPVSLEHLRQRHAATGGNRRSLPRPSG
jgi:DNA primase